MNAIADTWRQRPPRERAVFVGVAAVAALLLVVAFVWLPLERGRTTLRAEIPRLAGALATMERQREELKLTRALPPATAAAAPAALAAVVASGSIARGVTGAQVTLVDERRVRVVAADASYGAVLEAVAAAQIAHGLRVESARIDALPSRGRVRAELVLAKS